MGPSTVEFEPEASACLFSHSTGLPENRGEAGSQLEEANPAGAKGKSGHNEQSCT